MIWIEEDYPKKIREIWGKLVDEEMKDRRSNGVEVHLRYDRLIVSGKPSEENAIADSRREEGGKRSRTDRTTNQEKYERELRISKGYRR